jgi:transposase
MVSWEDVAVPKPYPQEFRDDVVRVVRGREPGVTVEQIARDFRGPPDDAVQMAAPGRRRRGRHIWREQSDSVELREARKRIKLLEQENEVLRRATAYLSQANLPGKGSTRS